MRWKKDLNKDIRFGDWRDDVDHPLADQPAIAGLRHWIEFSDCNRQKLFDSFMSIRDSCKVIVELGVYRNGDASSTHVFLNNKLDDALYLGVDIVDKSFLDNPQQNIHTIQTNSSNYKKIASRLQELGVNHIDYLFIDGWHSINQVYDDWEFTKILSPSGIVGFHDVTRHPGPFLFVQNLNLERWEAIICCPEDNGIAFVEKRKVI